jgi:hypothetical protein
MIDATRLILRSIVTGQCLDEQHDTPEEAEAEARAEIERRIQEIEDEQGLVKSSGDNPKNWIADGHAIDFTVTEDPSPPEFLTGLGGLHFRPFDLHDYTQPRVRVVLANPKVIEGDPHIYGKYEGVILDKPAKEVTSEDLAELKRAGFDGVIYAGWHEMASLVAWPENGAIVVPTGRFPERLHPKTEREKQAYIQKGDVVRYVGEEPITGEGGWKIRASGDRVLQSLDPRLASPLQPGSVGVVTSTGGYYTAVKFQGERRVTKVHHKDLELVVSDYEFEEFEDDLKSVAFLYEAQPVTANMHKQYAEQVRRFNEKKQWSAKDKPVFPSIITALDKSPYEYVGVALLHLPGQIHIPGLVVGMAEVTVWFSLGKETFTIQITPILMFDRDRATDKALRVQRAKNLPRAPRTLEELLMHLELETSVHPPFEQEREYTDWLVNFDNPFIRRNLKSWDSVERVLARF